MALQLSLRRGTVGLANSASHHWRSPIAVSSKGLFTGAASSNHLQASLSPFILSNGSNSNNKSFDYGLPTVNRRWASVGADAGDVIGIDLGTTNSCVAIMVRKP